MIIAFTLTFVLVLLVIVAAFERPRPKEPDGPMPCTRDDPRCEAVAQRLQQVRATMRTNGISTLFEGHQWTRGR